MIHSQTWTRKGKTTATKQIFKHRGQADAAVRNAEKRNLRVSRSNHFLLDPKTGERSRLFVVTTRPVATWERHAREERGYGVQ